jgi:hypothetical protein
MNLDRALIFSLAIIFAPSLSYAEYDTEIVCTVGKECRYPNVCIETEPPDTALTLFEGHIGTPFGDRTFWYSFVHYGNSEISSGSGYTTTAYFNGEAKSLFSWRDDFGSHVVHADGDQSTWFIVPPPSLDNTVPVPLLHFNLTCKQTIG